MIVHVTTIDDERTSRVQVMIPVYRPTQMNNASMTDTRTKNRM